jgi:hypothetical protein
MRPVSEDWYSPNLLMIKESKDKNSKIPAGRQAHCSNRPNVKLNAINHYYVKPYFET